MLLPKSFEILERNTDIFWDLLNINYIILLSYFSFLFYCYNNFNTDQCKDFHLIWG